uniref:Uncharacterized protein n=1 Tax=Anguilla anguilla TaxID=7936 RepID=A0A0E9WZ69_ANGAN
MTALPLASMTHAVQSALQTCEFTTRAQVSKTASYVQTHRGLKVWPRDAKFNLAQNGFQAHSKRAYRGKGLKNCRCRAAEDSDQSKGMESEGLRTV